MLEEFAKHYPIVEDLSPDSDFEIVVRNIAMTLKGNVEDIDALVKKIAGEEMKVINFEGRGGLYKGSLTVAKGNKGIIFIPFGPDSRITNPDVRTSLGVIRLRNINRVVCNRTSGVVSFIAEGGEKPVILKVDSECNFDFGDFHEESEIMMGWRIPIRSMWDR